MQRAMRVSVLTLLALAAVGCNTLAGQPKFTAAGIEPPNVAVGSSAVLSVTLKDKHLTVDKVEGVVKEDPRLKFRLRDDGKDPDAKAGDGTWSLRVDVPTQAPPGSFTVELTAYNDQGLPVLIRDENGEVGPMVQVIPVSIEAGVQQ